MFEPDIQLLNAPNQTARARGCLIGCVTGPAITATNPVSCAITAAVTTATASQRSKANGTRSRQYTREQAGQIAEYLSRYNSQSFYEMQPYMEPVAPFAPLPALLEAPAPTMTGSGPGGGAAALRIGGALLGGVKTGFSTYQGLKKYAG